MRRVLLLSLFAATTSACDSDGGGPQPRLSSIQDEIFTPKCGLSSCHSATARGGDLILEAGTSHGELVDVSPTNPAAADEGLVLVEPGNATASFLWLKLQPGLDAKYGLLMPQGSTDGLPSEDLEAIRGWIDAGAPMD